MELTCLDSFFWTDTETLIILFVSVHKWKCNQFHVVLYGIRESDFAGTLTCNLLDLPAAAMFSVLSVLLNLTPFLKSL